MAVAGDGSEVDGGVGGGGREPDGAGAVGQGGPDGREGGDGRVHEGQIAVAWVVEVAWSRSSRWWAAKEPDQGERGS